MNEMGDTKEPILVVGNCKLTDSIVVCLLRAGHRIIRYADEGLRAAENAEDYLACLDNPLDADRLKLLNQLDGSGRSRLSDCKLVVAVTRENTGLKKDLIRRIESVISPQAAIAVNTESIPLSSLQEGAARPERIIGLNWTEPAHTTYFLELIANDRTAPERVDELYTLARLFWQKDPYVVRGDCGIRTRMLCALIREAFYLVENGYVTVEDIDRACRNDAGYYLPFAGNFRYMDLMGAYIYGVVMQDMNPELSKDRHLPRFFEEIVQEGGQGMANGKGFYTYQNGDVEQWEAQFRQFSHQIRDLIEKYPFNYQETQPVETKQPLVHE